MQSEDKSAESAVWYFISPIVYAFVKNTTYDSHLLGTCLSSFWEKSEHVQTYRFTMLELHYMMKRDFLSKSADSQNNDSNLPRKGWASVNILPHCIQLYYVCSYKTGN